MDSSEPAPNEKCVAFGGMLVRKTAWRLSFRGWLVSLFVLGFILIGGVLGVHPFLAVTKPVTAEYLVVEGWIAPYAVNAGIAEFKAHPYLKIFTTGGPVASLQGLPDAEDYTYAQLAGSRLKQLGLSKEFIEMVPATDAERDRTFHSAMTLRQRLDETGIEVKALNIVTLGAHARRTRLLFEKAFGPDVKIGIIAIRNREYDPRGWWKYSEGVKEVCSEGMAYVYARFFF